MTNTETPDPAPLAITVKDLMVAFQISRRHAYALVYSGKVRSFKVGDAIRIPATEIDRILAEGVDVA